MELVFAALLQARALRRERRFRDRLDPLALSDQELLRHYRFPRHELLQLFQELDPVLRRRTKRMHAIPTHTQVLIALKVYASGSFQRVIGDTSGPSQSSVSRVFTRVTDVLSNKAAEEIKMPSTQEEMRASAIAFQRVRNFPKVIGAIDGTHVAIKAQSCSGSIYINGHGYHSLNVQVVCDANGLVISYCTRFPGSTHDDFIWKNCDLRQLFERGEFGDFLLLGDSGYPLEPFLMTPVAHPATPAEECYNMAHKETRVIIEQTFGVIKTRFRCLYRSCGELMYSSLRTAKIITACLLLHNRCVKLGIPVPPEELEEDEAPHVAPTSGDDDCETGKATRAEIIANFFNH